MYDTDIFFCPPQPEKQTKTCCKRLHFEWPVSGIPPTPNNSPPSPALFTHWHEPLIATQKVPSNYIFRKLLVGVES